MASGVSTVAGGGTTGDALWELVCDPTTGREALRAILESHFRTEHETWKRYRHLQKRYRTLAKRLQRGGH